MKNLFIKLQPLFLIGSLIYGGLGGQNFTFLTIVLLWFTVSFFILALSKKIITYPPGFFLYMIFLIIFSLSLFWTKDFWATFWYLLIFSCGFLFWITSYNLRDDFKNLSNLVIFVGIIFAALFFINTFYQPQDMDSFSIYKLATKDHYHIGDLWAAIIPIIAINFIKDPKKKFLWLVLIFLGTYLLYISQSRSALLSLTVGIIVILQNVPATKKYLPVIYALILTSLILFLFFGRVKPILFDRVYYLQGLAGLIKHPLGIGVGNFGLISANPENHLFGLNDYSSVAMNIILEMFTGMGIFALVFLLWFIKILNSVLKNGAEKNLVAKLIFLVITVNFMFNFAYLVPTMLWLWFISLGLSQKSSSSF